MIDVAPYISRMRHPPDQYQVEGTHEVVNKPLFFIADKPGSGKSKQAIDAACILYDNDVIDTVLVVCPAQVKVGWYDSDFGEILKHAFVPSLVSEFSSKRPIIPHSEDRLVWSIVSFEFGRGELYEKMLAGELKNRKVFVIIDESLRIANWKSQQHKVFKKLCHQYGDRVLELNGTPGNPIHLYGQFEVLDPSIIGCKNYYHFEARYCLKVPIYPGSPIKQVKEFVNKDLLDARIKPYILRREPKLSVSRREQVVNVALTPKTWSIYKQMRDSMLSWLGDKSQATASNAMVKGIRLAQLTSGLIGGVIDAPDFLTGLAPDDHGEYPRVDDDQTVAVVGDEKIKGLLEWIETKTSETEALRLIVWCRFRAEIFRLRKALEMEGLNVATLIGGQRKAERDEGVREFTSGSLSRPYILVGQQQAGGLGLNFVTCHYMMYMSNTFSYFQREQTELRIERKGQRFDCNFADMIATGPDGQRTIDHHIVKSLRSQESVARWTMEDWRRRLEDE